MKENEKMIKLKDILEVCYSEILIMNGKCPAIIIGSKIDRYSSMCFTDDFLSKEVTKITPYDNKIKVWLGGGPD